MSEPSLAVALARAAADLKRLEKRFALVGGLAVSIRGEVRFTRDVDLALAVVDDAETEAIAAELRSAGYQIAALVEQEARGRIAMVRLASPAGPTVDLLAASSGIEAEIVASAPLVEVPGIGNLPVAQAEDLLAMKVLSSSDERPLDAADARSLLLVNRSLDLDLVRRRLELIAGRGFARNQDLAAKLRSLLPKS